MKVHDFQPGSYMSQAANLERGAASPPMPASQSAQELHILGKLSTFDLVDIYLGWLMHM